MGNWLRSVAVAAAVVVVSFVVVSAQQRASSDTVQDEYATYELLGAGHGVVQDRLRRVGDDAGRNVVHAIASASGLSFVAGRATSVVDMMSGAPLKFEQETSGLRVHLARPVPADGGQARLRITKTYKDPKSYRPRRRRDCLRAGIGIRHAAFVLPAGYQLTDVQRAVAGAGGSRRPRSHQLHASGAGRGGARHQGGARARRPATPRSRGR